MKRYTVTEEMIFSPKYLGWRQGRIEDWSRCSDQDVQYPDELGSIRVPEHLFDKIRNIIEEDDDGA